MNVEVLDGPGDLADARAAWDALADAIDAPFCQRWAWTAAWHEAFAPDARLVLLVRRDGEQGWSGVLPMAHLERRVHRRVPVPLRYVGLAGSGPGAGDHLGPLVASSDHLAPLVAAALELDPRRSVYFESVDPSLVDHVASVARAGVVRRTSCPAVTLAGASSLETLWGAKVTKNVRRRERMLADAGIERQWIGPGAALAPALDALRAVHERRWRAQGQAGLFDDRRHRFLVALAAHADQRSGPWLQQLVDSSGAVVASLLGFFTGTTFSTYKTGWDPAYHAYGPGIALHAGAMSWAWQRGATTFDFMRGTGSHKYSLGATDRYDGSVLVRRGISGAVLSFRERER